MMTTWFLHKSLRAASRPVVPDADKKITCIADPLAELAKMEFVVR